jgi:hypothetical protein
MAPSLSGTCLLVAVLAFAVSSHTFSLSYWLRTLLACKEDVKGMTLKDVKGMTLEEAVKGMTLEEAVEGMTLEEAVEGMPLEEAVKDMTLEEAVKGFPILYPHLCSITRASL